jgi:hypothetical protein
MLCAICMCALIENKKDSQRSTLTFNAMCCDEQNRLPFWLKIINQGITFGFFAANFLSIQRLWTITPEMMPTSITKPPKPASVIASSTEIILRL